VADHKTTSSWTKEEVKLLDNAMVEIASGDTRPQVKDWAYYIAHYILHDTKSRKEVESRINQLIRRNLEDQNVSK